MSSALAGEFFTTEPINYTYYYIYIYTHTHTHIYICMCVCSYLLSCVWLFVIPLTVARQAPLAMGFSRQEYWSGLPCPPPGDIPDPRDRTQVSQITGGFFTIWATRENRVPEQGGSGEEIPGHFSQHLLEKPEVSQWGYSRWHLPQGSAPGAEKTWRQSSWAVLEQQLPSARATLRRYPVTKGREVPARQ